MRRDTSVPGLRFLVTGVTGQVGGELVKTLAPLGTVIAPLREELDLAKAESVRRVSARCGRTGS